MAAVQHVVHSVALNYLASKILKYYSWSFGLYDSLLLLEMYITSQVYYCSCVHYLSTVFFIQQI